MLKPHRIPENWLASAVAQVKANTWAQLEEQWLQLNFRLQVESAEAPWHMQFVQLRDFWMQCALVVVTPGLVQCCCPMSAQYGYPHNYLSLMGYFLVSSGGRDCLATGG